MKAHAQHAAGRGLATALPARAAERAESEWPLLAMAERTPRAAQLRALQALADASPRAAQLRALKTMADARARTDAPVQRVKFSQNDAEHPPAALTDDLRAAISAQYDGRTETLLRDIPLTDARRAWLTTNTPWQASELAALAQLTVQVQAEDWERLGVRAAGPPSIETAGMSQAFFDRQTALTQQIDAQHALEIAQHPGAALRVASFVFERVGAGPLLTAWTIKPMEPEVRAGGVVELPVAGGLRDQIQQNVNETLFSAGQFQWIAANWADISRTHHVFIDVDYYPNRPPETGGGLHKDSVGETLFVNLTYGNQAQAASAEYVHDEQPFAPFEGHMPASAQALVATARGNARAAAGPQVQNPDGSMRDPHLDVQGGDQDMPAHGRTSFLDPAIWHATPLYNHRLPEVTGPDASLTTVGDLRTYLAGIAANDPMQPASTLRRLLDVVELTSDELNRAFPTLHMGPGVVTTYARFSQFIAQQAWSPAERAQAVGLIDGIVAPKTFTGAQTKALFRQAEGFRMANRVGHGLTDLAPAARKTRRKSLALTAQPGLLPALRAQSVQPRSFIRTWIIVRPRPVAAGVP